MGQQVEYLEKPKIFSFLVISEDPNILPGVKCLRDVFLFLYFIPVNKYTGKTKDILSKSSNSDVESLRGYYIACRKSTRIFVMMTSSHSHCLQSLPKKTNQKTF